MFLDILLFMLLGILIGVITGLMPGIHPNTVFVAMVSAAALLSGVQTELMLVFIMALAVSNTFVDFLPSIIFGAPDPSTALSVLPGHRFLLEGRAMRRSCLLSQVAWASQCSRSSRSPCSCTLYRGYTTP